MRFVHRLMQAKKNDRLFKGLASLELAALLMNVFLVMCVDSKSGRLRSAALVIGLMMIAIPHMGVALQFQRVKEKCEKALKSQFGDDFLMQVDALRRDEQGFQKAIQLLQEQGSPTDFLEQKLDEFRAHGYSSSRVTQMLMDFLRWDQ